MLWPGCWGASVEAQLPGSARGRVRLSVGPLVRPAPSSEALRLGHAVRATARQGGPHPGQPCPRLDSAWVLRWTRAVQSPPTLLPATGSLPPPRLPCSAGSPLLPKPPPPICTGSHQSLSHSQVWEALGRGGRKPTCSRGGLAAGEASGRESPPHADPAAVAAAQAAVQHRGRSPRGPAPRLWSLPCPHACGSWAPGSGGSVRRESRL